MDRIYHTWEKWECYPAGFYENNAPGGITSDQANKKYTDFFSDIKLFEKNLQRVITEWKFSCEHYLTNEKMNRIAWIGQASMCIYSKIPSKFRGGYNGLSNTQKQNADNIALKYINIWMKNNKFSLLSNEEIKSKTTANIY